MSTVYSASGMSKELRLSWCQRQLIHSCQRLSELVIPASATTVGVAHTMIHDCPPGGMVCVGRALCDSEWCPGYFLIGSGAVADESTSIPVATGLQLFAASFDSCVRCKDFEVLIYTGLLNFDIDSHHWLAWQSSREVPDNALIAGTRQGLPVYVARTKVGENAYVIGGFVPHLRLATFNYQMRLLQRNRDFELLIMGSRTGLEKMLDPPASYDKALDTGKAMNGQLDSYVFD
ncbi:hypothetical protein BOX15_Mlig028244g1 [Macrostomum lignano]|uniref:Uncharacterized protein n=1 Tax=Macrostomum lignano TaxID=282301 RepID=A0A267EW48_9PLAT|nr:hypothetical protein BOX15_Mlig028244g1 [Macrostomum lignano]